MTEPRPASVPIVLLAAGLGSRFGGGVKPLAAVGPHGEPLLRIALGQAARAGFDRAVVVTGARTRAPIEDALVDPPLPVEYADQGAVGPARGKPWGTVAAVLAATPLAGGDGMVVANGDDLYGAPALRSARSWLASPDPADGLIVAYDVVATLSVHGGVSRAVVSTDPDGRLRRLSEQREVRLEEGRVTTASGLELAADAPVSMNLWAFRPRALERLAGAFAAFCAAHPGDPAAELGLPDAIASLLGREGLSLAVIGTASPWHGVTFEADVPAVRAGLTAEVQ